MMFGKYFSKREAKVERATAEQPTEAELQRQLAEVEIAIAAGEGDIVGMLEERESLKRQIQAASIAREKRETEAYRARINANATELRGRLDESLDELGDLVPRLLLACSHFNTIAAEVQEKGLGFTPGQLLEDIFCIPPDFGSRLTAAVREIAPRTEWDYGHIGILGKGVKAERPKLKGPQMIRTPRFAGDNGPPPNFTGTWNTIKGRPMEESDWPPVTFLPTPGA